MPIAIQRIGLLIYAEMTNATEESTFEVDYGAEQAVEKKSSGYIALSTRREDLALNNEAPQ